MVWSQRITVLSNEAASVICGGHSVVNLSCGSPRRAHLVCIHAGLTTYPLLVSSHLTAWISAIVS